MNTTKIIALAAIMLAIAFLTWLLQPMRLRAMQRSIRRQAYLLGLRFHRGTAPTLQGAQFCNIGEGTAEHGLKTFIPDAATTKRYLLYKTGVGTNGPAALSCTLTTTAADYPLGSSDDMADAAWVAQGITIKLFGAWKGTTRVISDGTILNGSWVGPSAATPGYTTVSTTGNCTIGRAIIGPDQVVAAGDPVEIIPVLPTKYAF